MSRLHLLSLTLLCAAFISLGCAGAGFNSPTSPLLATDNNISGQSSNHVLWGMWLVAIDRATGDVDIVPLRGVMFNCNVQQFLSPPFVPTHHMQIAVLPGSDLLAGYVECEVSLTHPFLGLEMYKGFDVRGIFMGNGSKASEHEPHATYGSAETEEPYMTNADGLTRWWNSTEFNDPMPLLSYKPGKLGSLEYPSAILNPYKYFADDLAADQNVADMDTSNRGVFSPTTEPNSRIYEIQFPLDGGMPKFLFNYAVDASWEDPDPAYGDDFPIVAFGPGAQCQEAYNVSVNDDGSDAWCFGGNSGGTLILNIEVFDWQGAVSSTGVPDELTALWVESPVLHVPLDILPFASIENGGPTSSVFTAELTGSDLSPTASGEFPLLGSVVSASPNTYAPQLPGGEFFSHPDAPLAAYFTGSVTIAGDPGALAPIVTGIDPDQGYIDMAYADVVVSGLFFQDGATIDLVNSDDPPVVIPASDVVFVDATELTCAFDFDHFTNPEIVAGFYHVVVTNPDNETGQLDDGFEIVDFPCAPNEWGDNFDSYSPGAYPTGWENFWSGSTGAVSNAQSYSAPNSFRQTAYSSWARYDGYPFTAAGKTFVCYEMKVMLTDVSKRAIMGFAWKTSSSTTGHYGIIVIGSPGDPDYVEPYVWYHVLAKMDMETEKWRVWVDDELVRDGDIPCSSGYTKDYFTHFFVGLCNFTTGGMSEGYYDDVWLYWAD